MSLYREKQLPVSPFSDEYWKAELKAYGLRKSRYVVEHVSIDWFKIQGRCDDYLNVNMRFDETPLPRLGINGHLWMSLTPMEIQSAALAIFRAKGVVATGGLGLGYFAIRAAAKPEVTKVIVFENEPLLVEWFKRMFKDRPEMAKIEFVEGDVRKTFKGYTVDFVFMDVYSDMLPEAIIKDARRFRRTNQIGRYHFWGYEKVVLERRLPTLGLRRRAGQQDVQVRQSPAWQRPSQLLQALDDHALWRQGQRDALRIRSHRTAARFPAPRPQRVS